MDVYATGEVISDDDKWIYDWLDWKCICPQDIRDAIASCEDGEINLYIDSPGGDVCAASTIRALLASCGKKTKAVITGLAASAATVIMTGCETIEAYSTALIMIHKAWCTVGSGNADDMQKAKDMLDSVDSAIANAYVTKTGKSKDEVLSMMAQTKWMDIDEAKENGFIDKIIDGKEEELQAVASFTGYSISNRVREKFKNLKNGVLPQKQQTIDTEKIVDEVMKRIAELKEQEAKNSSEMANLQDFAKKMEGKYA